MSTPGYQINPETLKKTSIFVTYPNDGMIFKTGQVISVVLSHLFPDNSVPYQIELLINGKQVAYTGKKLRIQWKPDNPGIYILEALVKNTAGAELYRSPKVDIIVQSVQ